jgi:hypothetical protein
MSTSSRNVVLGTGSLFFKIKKDRQEFCLLIDSDGDGNDGNYIHDAELCFKEKEE